MFKINFKVYFFINLQVPKIYDEFSSSRVLTLEFFEGGQINDLDYINRNK